MWVELKVDFKQARNRSLSGGKTNEAVGGNDLWSSAEAGHEAETEVKLQRNPEDRWRETFI